MKRIKIVIVNDNTLPINEGYEEAVNVAICGIEEEGNNVTDIKYCVSDRGAIKGVIIEFEAFPHREEI